MKSERYCLTTFIISKTKDKNKSNVSATCSLLLFTFSSFRSVTFRFAPLSLRYIRQTFIRSTHKFRHRTQEKRLQYIPFMLPQFHFVLDLLCHLTKPRKQIHSTSFHPDPYSFHSFQSLHLPYQSARKLSLKQ